MQSELFEDKIKISVPYSKSLLKSAIQKAVRRGDVDKAVKCTKSLIDKEPVDCLRRLMIIVLEDCLLHPGFADLAKLTDRISRRGGAVLTENEKTVVLTIVADIARCEYRDFHKDNPDEVDIEGLNRIEEDELKLVNAIVYRSRIGGMPSDTGMFYQYSKIWQYRFGNGSWNVERLKGYFTGEVVNYSDVAYATNDDILLPAVDFHCSPVGRIVLKKSDVIAKLQKAFPMESRKWAEPWTSDEDILNKIVWCLRSGVCPKKIIWRSEPVDWLVEDKIPEQYWSDFKTIYNQIEGELDAIALWFLRKVTEGK
jgi:hypothetical protein